MNKIVNRFLLTGDRFMSKLYPRQQRFTYSTCGLFTEYREGIQTFRERGNLKHIYKSKLDKACFAHNAAYSGSKNLANITISYKILKKKSL